MTNPAPARLSKSTSQQRATTIPNTVEQTEVVLARYIGVFALLLTALALPDLLQVNIYEFEAGYFLFVALIPTLTIALMLPRVRPHIRARLAGTVAWMILTGFLLWQLGLLGSSLSADARPWSWGIAGAGVGLAAVAKNTRLAILYGVLFAVLVLLIPLLPAGSSRAWSESWQDALLTLAMTSVIIAPIWALRRAVLLQDQVALAAVEKFASAARSEAESTERRRLDALTHDVILSTLIVAAQARTPEVASAASRAATEALAQLGQMRFDAGSSDDGFLTVGEWLGGLQSAVGHYDVQLQSLGEPDISEVPAAAARALHQAASEAVRNAAEHAPGATITVSVAATRQHLRLVITDDGPGFELAAIPLERMGVRISMVERMRAAGGYADITSVLGQGSCVTLSWPGGGDKHGSIHQ